jgi:hypothetical protein
MFETRCSFGGSSSVMKASCFVATLLASGSAIAGPDSGSMNWNDWSFSWTINAPTYEGLVLTDVRWKGVKVLYKASMPVIRVQYANNACGPYADRIYSGNMIANPDCPNDKVCVRQFSSDLMDIGIQAHLGGYYIGQVWSFTRSGVMGAHLWSRGWHCNVSHRHHPYWRLDFDVEVVNDQILHYRQPGGPIQWFEIHNEGASALAGVPGGWVVRNPSGPRNVGVTPGPTEVGDAFSPWDAEYRLYKSAEDAGWPWGAFSQLPFNEGEDIWGRDIVFWRTGHLSHTWDGSDPQGANWHGTSVFIYPQW